MLSSAGASSLAGLGGATKSCSLASWRPSTTASAILLANSRMARRASSLPGITQSTSSGSQLVSTMATTGMPSRCASFTAIASLFESITKSTSGKPGMSLMPDRFCSRCLRSRSRRMASFFGRPAYPPASGDAMASSSFSRLMDFWTVAMLVSKPPSQRWLTKYIWQRTASSAMASCAWRLVPTKSTFLPCAAISWTNRAASLNIFKVFCRSMM